MAVEAPAGDLTCIGERTGMLPAGCHLECSRVVGYIDLSGVVVSPARHKLGSRFNGTGVFAACSQGVEEAAGSSASIVRIVSPTVD